MTLRTRNCSDLPSGPVACATRQVLLSSLALILRWWRSLVNTPIFSNSSLKLQGDHTD
ncbi:hypothetical protein LEMLEM_LOCUS23006 [Lemmus lemmus]